METICLFVTVGLIMAVLFVGIGVCIGRLDKGELDRNRDLDSDISIGDGNRVSDNGCDKQMDAEEVINGLQDLRMALSEHEKEYLDYACDCVSRIDKLQKMIRRVQENGNSENN